MFIFAYAFFLIVYNKIQQAHAARFLAFPKSIWRLSETEKASQDIFIEEIRLLNDEESRKLLKEYLGKECNEKFFYYVKFSPPVALSGIGVFDKAVWILPDRWEEVFQFTSGLTAWFQAQVIEHPKAEYVTLYIPSPKAKIEYMGETIPVAYVADSTWHLRNFRKPLEQQVDVKEVESAKVALLLNENVKLRQMIRFYEEHITGLLKTIPDLEEMVIKRMDTVAQLQARIYGVPLSVRIKSKLSWRTLAIIGIIVAIILIGLYYRGWI